MATDPIITIDQVKQMGFRGIDGISDQVFDSCILAATDAIQGVNAPRIYIAPAAAAAETYNGAWAHGECGSREWLTLDNYPVISLSAITEDGVAVTFGTDFAAYDTLDAWVDMVRGKIRKPAWSYGYSNIVVTHRSGYADESLVPWDLKMAAGALSILYYRSAESLGLDSVQRGDGNTSLVYDLPAVYQETIFRHGPVGRTICR